MLAADPDTLTAHDIAAEATWADHYRDADIAGSRAHTRQWHFVDIELRSPSLDEACFSHPPLAPGTPASLGPAAECLVDKIDQFSSELAGPAAPAEERLLALKYLLHLVGDLHQPLHASDDADRGGNASMSPPRLSSGHLHHYWDSEFVANLGPVREIAAALREPHPRSANGPAVRRPTGRCNPSPWPAKTPTGSFPRPTCGAATAWMMRYIATATRDTQLQLTRAGVRLAAILNRALSTRAQRSR